MVDFIFGHEGGSRACLVPIKRYALAGQLEDYQGFYRWLRELLYDFVDTYTEDEVLTQIEAKLKKLAMAGWVEVEAGKKLYRELAAIIGNVLIPL